MSGYTFAVIAVMVIGSAVYAACLVMAVREELAASDKHKRHAARHRPANEIPQDDTDPDTYCAPTA